jgi:serine-protein kinase ATM
LLRLFIAATHTHSLTLSHYDGKTDWLFDGLVVLSIQLLPVPELVPFRMTRNIVDGFGPLGTQGVFTEAAEDTMKALRENADAVLTILSSIVADPLYMWSVSPVKARQRQERHDSQSTMGYRRLSKATSERMDENNANEAATHAITRIQEKLNGYENGTSGEQQSVTGQIQVLTSTAQDPDKLCIMFSGWAPFM